MIRFTHTHRLVALAIASLLMAGSSFAKDDGGDGHGKDEYKHKASHYTQVRQVL